MSQKPRKFLVSPSTLEFLRESKRTPGYSWFDALHGYVYGRWTYLYISLGVGEHRYSKRLGQVFGFLAGLWDDIAGEASDEFSLLDTPAKSSGVADTYHGKVLPLESARRLLLVNENVELRDLEKIIPYPKARDIVLSNPEHILALECPCRSARSNPCLPLDVCLIIGEPFVSFVAEHHPRRSRWITQEEAVDILQAEDERGHVHHAFFKDAMFGRYYAICNCCSCCCGAMQAQKRGTPMLASSGYTCELDETQCIGCGECVDTCQFSAISFNDLTSAIDDEKCMGCGICVSHCTQGALSLVRDASKGEPLEILALMQQANAEL